MVRRRTLHPVQGLNAVTTICLCVESGFLGIALCAYIFRGAFKAITWAWNADVVFTHVRPWETTQAYSGHLITYSTLFIVTR